MKKILITGANSYIGTSFERWVRQWPSEYEVNTINLIDDSWRENSFSGYDVIYHVAGIAHIKETIENKDLYYKINRDLAIEVAKKGKYEGVKHFIFLSSMSVYGKEQGVIDKETLPSPVCHYGKSKYEAEESIMMLADTDYKISVLRPPMVYGKRCKGNFVKLDKLTNIVFLFPYVTNKRSMVYIENLNEFVRLITDKEITGILCPQNDEYVCTSNMIELLRIYKRKKVFLVPGFQGVISKISKYNRTFSKVFGNLIYDQSLSDIGYSYQVVNFNESIKRSL